MTNLEYKIGELQVNSERLKLFSRPRSDTRDAGHKFVVGALDSQVSIYVAEVLTEDSLDIGPTASGAKGYSHNDVVQKFGISEETIVGGGRCYLTDEGLLVLNDFSGKYKAIPKAAARKFAQLMLPELEKIGIVVREIAAYPTEFLWGKDNVNPYWRNQGFSSE